MICHLKPVYTFSILREPGNNEITNLLDLQQLLIKKNRLEKFFSNI